jgi:hypothetical protein
VTTYRDVRSYSAIHDSEVSRLSMTNDRGEEYFAIVPVEDGKRWRERRDAVLTALDDAILAGATPGEIRI